MYLVPAPHIITHPTDTSAAAPFSGVFTCSVQAYGKISIEWEGKDNLPRPVRLSSPELTTSTLTIPNVTEDDVGTYHCVAWANQIGAISNQAKLTLAGMHSTLYCIYCIHVHIYCSICIIQYNT